MKKWGAPKIIGLVIGIPLCALYFGYQFFFAALLVGGIMVWEMVGEWRRHR